MAKLKLAFLVLCLPFLAAGTAMAQQWSGPTSLGIEVREKSGKPMAGARVLLQYAEIQPFDGPPATVTDDQGRVEIIHLASGRWRIDIQSGGRTAYTVVVRIEPGKKPAITAGPIRDAVAQPLKVQFAKSPKAPGSNQASLKQAKKKDDKKDSKTDRGRSSSRRGRETAQAPKPAKLPTPKDEAKPVVAEPEPTMAKPEPAMAKPEPIKAKPATANPAPSTTRPARPERPASTGESAVVATPKAQMPPGKAEEAQAEQAQAKQAQTKQAQAKQAQTNPLQPAAVAEPKIEKDSVAAAEIPAPKGTSAKASTDRPPAPKPDAPPKAPEAVDPKPSATKPSVTKPSVTKPSVTKPSIPNTTIPEPDPPKVVPTPAPQPLKPAPVPVQPVTPPVPPPAALPSAPKEPVAKAENDPPRAKIIPTPASPGQPAAPTAPPKAEREAPAEIPVVEAPSVKATPSGLESRQRTEIRSFTEPSCPGCKPGEWALIVEQEVAAATSRKGCPGSADQLHDTLRGLADSAGPVLGTHRGPILNLTDADQRRSIAPFMSAEGNCQAVAAALPKGTRFAGYGYEVRDSTSGGNCQADEDCSIGQAKWLGHPSVVKSGENSLVYGLFENRSTERPRTARLILYFKAPKGWRPPR